jgi:hypothetical protein
MLRSRIESALESMVPTAASCLETARRLRSEHPSETPEQLARRAIRSARRSAAAAGAATGAVANPLVMIPAALADMAFVLRIEGALAGTLAALLDPHSLTDQDLRADVVSILFPGAVSQALRQVGIRVGEQVGQRLSAGIVREFLSKDVARTAMRMVTRHLGMELTRKAVLEKTAPLVGAGIGAGWNWVEVGVVGERALQYYGKFPITVSPIRALRNRLGEYRPISAVVRRVRDRMRPGLSDTAFPTPPALPGPGD